MNNIHCTNKCVCRLATTRVRARTVGGGGGGNDEGRLTPPYDSRLEDDSATALLTAHCYDIMLLILLVGISF